MLYALKQFVAGVTVIGSLLSTIAYWTTSIPWLAGLITEQGLGRVMWALPWWVIVMTLTVATATAVCSLLPDKHTPAGEPEDEGW
jgi:hypothetical protein